MSGTCEDCDEWTPVIVETAIGGDARIYEICRGCFANREAIIEAAYNVFPRRSARIELKEQQ